VLVVTLGGAAKAEAFDVLTGLASRGGRHLLVLIAYLVIANKEGGRVEQARKSGSRARASMRDAPGATAPAKFARPRPEGA